MQDNKNMGNHFSISGEVQAQAASARQEQAVPARDAQNPVKLTWGATWHSMTLSAVIQEKVQSQKNTLEAVVLPLGFVEWKLTVTKQIQDQKSV